MDEIVRSDSGREGFCFRLQIACTTHDPLIDRIFSTKLIVRSMNRGFTNCRISTVHHLPQAGSIDLRTVSAQTAPNRSWDNITRHAKEAEIGRECCHDLYNSALPSSKRVYREGVLVQLGQLLISKMPDNGVASRTFCMSLNIAFVLTSAIIESHTKCQGFR